MEASISANGGAGTGRAVAGIGMSGMARGPGRPLWDCGRATGTAWRCGMWSTRERSGGSFNGSFLNSRRRVGEVLPRGSPTAEPAADGMRQTTTDARPRPAFYATEPRDYAASPLLCGEGFCVFLGVE